MGAYWKWGYFVNVGFWTEIDFRRVAPLRKSEMRRILIYIFLIFNFLCVPAMAGHGVVVVLSLNNSEQQDKTLNGFRKICKEEITLLHARGMKISEIEKELKRLKPALVFVLGTSGLHKIKGISNIPIVYAIVLRPEKVLSGEANITGVSLLIHEKEVFKTLARLAPGRKKCVGALYSERTVQTANTAWDIAGESAEFTFFGKRVENKNAFPSLLKKLTCDVNVFWLLLDYSVYQTAYPDIFFRQCRKKNVGGLSHNPGHNKLGALVTIEEDEVHIGSQAGAMAVRILQGAPVSSVPPEDPGKYTVRVHLDEAERLGFEITDEVLKTIEPYVHKPNYP